MDDSIILLWAIVVLFGILISVSAVSRRSAPSGMRVRNLQAKAAVQVFGTLGLIVFASGLLLYGGYLQEPANVLGISVVALGAFSKFSPVHNAFSFIMVAYRTEFQLDDWVRIQNVNGEFIGKAKDFNLKGVKLKSFDMSETIVPNEEILKSLVENLTPDNLFRWTTTLTVSKSVDIKKIEQIINHVLMEQDLTAINDELGYTQQSYIEYYDDKMDFRPAFRRINVYTYHPKWVQAGEHVESEPIGYECAYQLSLALKKELYSQVDTVPSAYTDPMVKP